ncbi:MAG: asparaginase [Sporichthyaceae bacterium]
MTDAAVLIEVVRSGFVECVHRGSVVALDADGSVAFALGDPPRPILPRSSNKPMQAVAMLRAGLDLNGKLLALACASHSGEPFHLDGVREILAGAGLDESALQTPPDYPVDEIEMLAYVARGGRPSSAAMNCSGKHAAMLATCVHNGWPTTSYRDVDHPLQRAVRAAIEDLATEKVSATGVDGCGAPVFGLTLAGLARAFRAIVLAGDGTAEQRVASAIRSHPQWLGGTRRDVTRLIEGVPGLIAKDGAEGVYAAALPDGRAVALKIDDGGQRARPPVMAAALARLGVDAPVLAELSSTPLLGGGVPVGDVRFAGW